MKTMRYQFTTIDSIFAKLERDFGTDWMERDVIEWTGDALGFIGARRYYEEAVAFIEVRNHQCVVPKMLQGIIQIARDNEWSAQIDSDLCPQLIKTEVCPENPFRAVLKDGCDVTYPVDKDGNPVPDYVLLDHNGQPINDYDVAYYRPYFDLIGEYYLWTSCRRYKARYTPVRASSHTFAAAGDLICTERDQQMYRGCTDTYTVIKPNILRFSFKEGSIALSYLRTLTDRTTGYPMVPDHTSYQEAVVRHVIYRILNKQCYSGREGACGKADKADAQWQWYCKQARNADTMPYGVDEHQDLLDQRSYILPTMSRYYGFFGNLTSPEIRTWNNPRRMY